jgi:hypothetical protein
MGFKRTVLIIAAITFLVMMLMMALVIKNSYKLKMFPAVVSKCPDYWVLKDGECKPDSEIENNTNTGSINSIQPLEANTAMARIKACRVATDSNIKWDGITGRNLCLIIILK